MPLPHRSRSGLSLYLSEGNNGRALRFRHNCIPDRPPTSYFSLNSHSDNKNGMPFGHPVFIDFVFHTPVAIRTRDLQLRRLTLYPAELRVPTQIKIHQGLMVVNCRNANIDNQSPRMPRKKPSLTLPIPSTRIPTCFHDPKITCVTNLEVIKYLP